MNLLYYYLKSTIGFASTEIGRAFITVNRADFVLSADRALAYQDHPLPIGFGSTISQPTTVAFMLNQLNPKIGDKVLDVGSGSGWTTALLASIVGSAGKVTGIEIIPELVEFGNLNLSKYKFSNAKVVLTGRKLGLPKQSLFDRILVSAAAKTVPEALLKQLTVGGRMVIPVRFSIFVIDRKSEDTYDQEEFPGFMFVPLKT